MDGPTPRSTWITQTGVDWLLTKNRQKVRVIGGGGGGCGKSKGEELWGEYDQNTLSEILRVNKYTFKNLLITPKVVKLVQQAFVQDVKGEPSVKSEITL